MCERRYISVVLVKLLAVGIYSRLIFCLTN